MVNRTPWVALFACGLASAAAGCGGASDPNGLFATPSSNGGTGGAAAAGGSHSGGSAATGGTTATGGTVAGGTTSSGGTTAIGGTVGSGGNSAAGTTASGGSSAVGGGGAGTTCTSGATLPPVAALITDFSDAVPDASVAGGFTFGGGVTGRVQGGITRFANPASTPGTVNVGGGALSFSATVSAPAASGPDQYPFNGFVLYIDGAACVDASAYTGVSFDLYGNLQSCNLTLAFAYADDLATTSDPNRGLCSGNCYPSQFLLTISSKSVSFTDSPTVMGMPVATVDKKKLLGVQWQLVPSGTESCTANFTLDNVKFQ